MQPAFDIHPPDLRYQVHDFIQASLNLWRLPGHFSLFFFSKSYVFADQITSLTNPGMFEANQVITVILF